MALPPPGDGEHRTLSIGPWALAFEGLDSRLAEAMDARWGGFLSRTEPARASTTQVRLTAAGPAAWLEAPRPGELYRIEGSTEEGRIFVRSYHFALAEDHEDSWRLAVAPTSGEPADRILDNAARYLIGRSATRAGGLALHGAAVLRGGLVYVLAGPSRSGKTTAVSFAAPAESLGDDFAVVLPGDDGWKGMAVPFDNRESAPLGPPRGLLALAGVWRLFQSDEDREDVPSGASAAASLLSCAAFPWAMPDLADALAAAAGRFVAESRFAHLRFRKSPDFWRVIDPPSATR